MDGVAELGELLGLAGREDVAAVRVNGLGPERPAAEQPDRPVGQPNAMAPAERSGRARAREPCSRRCHSPRLLGRVGQHFRLEAGRALEPIGDIVRGGEEPCRLTQSDAVESLHLAAERPVRG